MITAVATSTRTEPLTLATVCLVPQITASDLSGFRLSELCRSQSYMDDVHAASVAETWSPVVLSTAIYIAECHLHIGGM